METVVGSVRVVNSLTMSRAIASVASSTTVTLEYKSSACRFKEIQQNSSSRDHTVRGMRSVNSHSLDHTYSYSQHCKEHAFTLQDIWRSPCCITSAVPCSITYRLCRAQSLIAFTFIRDILTDPTPVHCVPPSSSRDEDDACVPGTGWSPNSGALSCSVGMWR